MIKKFVAKLLLLAGVLAVALHAPIAANAAPVPKGYADGRPVAKYRLDAQDAGVVLKHGDGPKQCDYLGARDIWVWESGGTYFMHYDGAGTNGWLACLATSKDLTNWTKFGPVLQLGNTNEDDSKSASYGTTFFDGTNWQMFYLGTRRTSPAPNLVPATPYVTMKAFANSPSGPWTKQTSVVPFRCQPGTYFSDTASPGFIVRQGDEYLMFFSAAKRTAGKLQRTLGIARTKSLDAAWTPDAQPIVPPTEQIENSSLYFEPANQTWFLFCNHIGIENNSEFTDAVWVYWTKDLNHWNPDNKAVVLDGTNCRWSRKCIGLPSVLKVGNRLAIFYDGQTDSTSHMKRDVGLAWLELPLNPPIKNSSSTNEHPITVVSYYFGNYHPGDPRNVKTKGADWSEWELVKNARPRFPGHPQPHVPFWGYQDESDPAVMANKINAAADHGIGAFIFDWYYYNDGPFLDRPIDRGFLQATNSARLKFAFMWANHDWQDIFPYHHGAQRKTLYPGRVTPEAFEKICDHLIKDYFTRTNYWRIDGKPYFSFYDLSKLLQNFGSVEATRAALDQFRAKAKAAGLPGLHLNAVAWGRTILPAEKTVADPARLVHDLGFDSVTSYVWIHHAGMPEQQTEYNFVRDEYFNYWAKAATNFGLPYIPNVTMGWDPSPRADQSQEFGNFGYPFTNTIKDNSPENFRAALELAKQRLLAETNGLHILNLNCWNEWTEGSYLEPDTVHGFQYLNAVKEVFSETKLNQN